MGFDLGHWMRRPGGGEVIIGQASRWLTKGVIADREARYQRLLIEYRLALAMGMTHKVWQTIGDDKARPDHSEASGQQQPINSPFVVGGERLFLPSDPGASLHQTANCRCFVRYVRLQTDRLASSAPSVPEPPAPGGIQPPESPALPAIVPPANRAANPGQYTIDLRDHEGPLTGGHTLRDHVGKSREQIRRIMNTPTLERVVAGKKIRAVFDLMESDRPLYAIVLPRFLNRQVIPSDWKSLYSIQAITWIVFIGAERQSPGQRHIIGK